MIEMVLPDLEPPNPDRFPDIMWFIGLDPAVKIDNFGVVVHGLPPKPDAGIWNPMLREVFEIDHPHFTDIIGWINTVLFVAYRPTYCIIDATRDTPTAQEMETKYGQTVVKAASMTNKLNYQMKQNGWSFLAQGYKWPNTAIMKNRAKAAAISELQKQCLHERVMHTEDNRLKFSHPPGAHNDLNRAWEMSLMAVREFQLGRVGPVPSGVYRDYPRKEIVDYDEPQGSFAIPEDFNTREQEIY